MRSLFLLIVVLAWCAGAFANESHDHNDDHDSHAAVTGDSIPGSGSGAVASAKPGDSAVVAPAPPKLRLVSREHDYKRQVYLAAGMMAFIAIIMSSAQSWNPR